ncbi:hypothetical protein ACFRI7_14070 [Streptomyces sp. NPDC056716]|uniref:hypothetical protein n=1 Tax=unclassified Streptomyces TaxID=2593676 RepID=UPI0036834321
MNTYLGRDAEPGLTIFDARLGITVLDAVGPHHPGAGRIVEELNRRITESLNGYAARDVLSHGLFTALATESGAQACRDLVRSCGLGTGVLPEELASDLSAALDRSERVITRSLGKPT